MKLSNFHSTEINVWGPVIQDGSQKESHSIEEHQRHLVDISLFYCSWTSDHRQREHARKPGTFKISIITSAF